MNILNASITINIKLDNKEELVKTVNLLLTNDITTYVISEETSVIGSYKLTGEVTKSSIANGYIITIYSKSLEVVNVINSLFNE